MTNEQWEAGMQELRDAQIATQHLLGTLAQRHDAELAGLRDAQLVTQQMMQANERKWDERFERMAINFERIAINLEAHKGEISELRAALNSLIANIDRFVQGRQSNGH